MKKFLQNSLSYATAYGVTLITVASAAAALIDPSGGDKPSDVMSEDFRGNVISITNYILGFLGLVAVGFIVYAGFQMVTSGGEEKAISNGKKIITYAAIGIIIILLSYAIVNVFVGAGGTTGQ